jgi:hypothetical protein
MGDKDENKRARWENDRDEYFTDMVTDDPSNLNELLTDLDTDEEIRIQSAALKYVEKLGEAAWGYFATQIRADEDWAEAGHQSMLIFKRLADIEISESLDDQRERVFLKYYVRHALLPAYAEFVPGVPLDPEAPQACPPLGRGIPIALIHILNLEYPGDYGLLNLLAFEGKKPFSKKVAIDLVKRFPKLSQGELARSCGVAPSTIRTSWSPDLIAAGWKGPQQTSSDKSEEPDDC